MERAASVGMDLYDSLAAAGQSDACQSKTNGVNSTIASSAIQSTIRRYGWQAAVTRWVAIVLAAAYFLVLGAKAGLPMRPVMPASLRLWPVVCLFLLWVLDGHFTWMQKSYAELWRETVRGRSADLTAPAGDAFNVGSLWRPMVMAPYIVLIGLIALVNLGF